MMLAIFMLLPMIAILSGLVMYGFVKYMLRPEHKPRIVAQLALIWVVSGVILMLGSLICFIVWQDEAIVMLARGTVLGYWTVSLMAIVILVALPFAYWQGRVQSGECLLYLGYTGMHYALLLCGVASAILALGFVGFVSGWTLGRITMIVVWSLLGVFCLLAGFMPLQIRENGILWLYLINWDRIQSYCWRKNILVLSFKYRNKDSLFRLFNTASVRFSVPLQQREFVDEALRQNVPNSKSSDA